MQLFLHLFRKSRFGALPAIILPPARHYEPYKGEQELVEIPENCFRYVEFRSLGDWKPQGRGSMQTHDTFRMQLEILHDVNYSIRGTLASKATPPSGTMIRRLLSYPRALPGRGRMLLPQECVCRLFRRNIAI